MGTTCVVGADKIEVDPVAGQCRVGERVIREGEVIAIDGSSGEVFYGEVPVMASPVVRYLEDGLDAAIAEVPKDDKDQADLVRAVDRILKHADTVRRLKVHANADTPEDAHRARALGAEGIGLCRTCLLYTSPSPRDRTRS